MHKNNIDKAQYQKDFKIFLSFDNGLSGIVDLKGFVFSDRCGVFKALQNQENFKNFSLRNHTLIWNEDLDLAPEFLYELLKKQLKQELTGAS